ncbi:hypothetical protein Btru_028190, partial [Bulinus truncatus]
LQALADYSIETGCLAIKMDADFDSLVDHWGMGRFQLLVTMSIASTQLTLGWSSLHLTFAGRTPDFTCLDVGENEKTALLAAGNASMNVCETNGTRCLGYDFDDDGVSSVIPEWNLVCDLRWVVPMFTLLQLLGVLAGAVVAGQLSDAFGRRMTLYPFMLQHIIFNFLAAYSSSWAMFAVTRFFVGVGIGAINVVVLPYSVEFLPARWRPLMAITPWRAISVGLFAGAALLLDDWSNLHLACCLFSVPPLIFCVCVPESIRWLAVRGRIKEAGAVLTKISRFNRRSLPDNAKSFLERILQKEKELHGKGRCYSYIDIFNSRQTAKRSLILCFMWFALASANYITPPDASPLSKDVFINLFWLELVEIPAKITSFLLTNKIGRRWSTLVFYSLTTLATFGCLLTRLTAFDDVGGTWRMGMSLTARLVAGASLSCVQTWGTELYPTVTRSLGYGFSNLGARIADVAFFFILSLDQSLLTISYIIVTIFLALSAILAVLLPETKDAALVDSIDSLRHYKDDDNAESRKPLYYKEEEADASSSPRPAAATSQV